MGLKSKSKKVSQEDEEANYFAMCLLMPADFVEAEIKKCGLIDLTDERSPGLKKLARKFGVSEALMTIRLGQLGYYGNRIPL